MRDSDGLSDYRSEGWDHDQGGVTAAPHTQEEVGVGGAEDDLADMSDPGSAQSGPPRGHALASLLLEHLQ